MKINSRNRGFTLIELMIVMVLIAILVALGLTSFVSTQQKGRDSKRKADLKSFMGAMELYNSDTGAYPVSDNNGKIIMNGAAVNFGTIMQNSTTGVIYMPKLPIDPSLIQQYYYDSDGTGTYYQLYARIENQQDKDLVLSGGNVQVYQDTTCATGASTCNYGVSSSNVTMETGGHSLIAAP